MTEQEYIDKINELLSKHRLGQEACEAADRAADLAKDALGFYPKSSRLLILMGDAIVGGSDNPLYDLSDAKVAYEQATQLAPNDPEPFAALGQFLDSIENSPWDAVAPLEYAVSKGADAYTWKVLGRSLAQTGVPNGDIIRRLESCPFSEEDEVLEIIEEIKAGLWSE